jgi:hypothetical protein
VLIGNGVSVMFAAVASALLGTWIYGFLRPKLPRSEQVVEICLLRCLNPRAMSTG